MKTLKTSYCLFLLISISILPVLINAAEEQKTLKKASAVLPEIKVKKIKFPPFLDGIAVDKCWQITPAEKILVPQKTGMEDFTLKACSDGKKIFFLIQYLTKTEERKHQSWHWDPVLQAYIPGKEKEETLTIILAKKPKGNKEADVWIWRAGRTDPVNKADDLFYLESHQQSTFPKAIIMDKGTNCWFSKYFGDYAGAQLPRFYNRMPKGSVADVSAKGTWDKNHLNIEFSRKLQTGQKDDIQLDNGTYFIQIYRGTPTVETINNNLYMPLIIK